MLDIESQTTKFRVEGVVPSNLFTVLACFYETELLREWLPGCGSSSRIHSESMFRQLFYLTFPFPFVVRDAFGRGYGDVTDDGTVLIFLKSIPPEAAPPGVDVPPVHGARVNVNGVFKMKARSENETDFEVSSHWRTRSPCDVDSVFMGVVVGSASLTWIRSSVLFLDG
jgi:hypothetical protein